MTCAFQCKTTKHPEDGLASTQVATKDDDDEITIILLIDTLRSLRLEPDEDKTFVECFCICWRLCTPITNEQLQLYQTGSRHPQPWRHGLAHRHTTQGHDTRCTPHTFTTTPVSPPMSLLLSPNSVHVSSQLRFPTATHPTGPESGCLAHQRKELNGARSTTVIDITC